jgi:hypothetical protein
MALPLRPMWPVAFTCLLFAGALSAALPQPACAADAPAPPAPGFYPQMGAPMQPKVAARFDQYHDQAQLTQLLRDLAAAYPEYAHLESIGKSYHGHDLWVLTITDPATGAPEHKPAMWIDGCIHANEIQGTEVVLYTAWFLLETRATNTAVQRLLRERTFYLLPVLSPDSRELHFYNPADTTGPRSGQRPVDDDRDGLIDEDGPDDLDGDGSITQMRIADPNGRWLPDPDYPQRMVRARPDQPGQYTLLGEEGVDQDGDGNVNEDAAGGYDPNRNWGYNWQPEYVQGGAHNYPFSIMEDRIVADFIAAHPNIAGAQSYHNSGGMILHGPGMEERPYDWRDDAVFNAIGAKGEEILPGYKSMVIWRDLYTVYGGSVDWLYACRGILAFTDEMWANDYEYFHSAQPQDDWGGGGNPGGGGRGGPRRSSDARRFDDLLLLDQGYVPWHAVDHPQYGRIEVGGVKKSWGRQPPSFMLEQECHRNMAFSLYHADQLPLLGVQDVRTRPLPGGLTEVTAVIANTRLAPSRLQVDIAHGLTRPDRVRLSTRGIVPLKVVTGYWSDEPFFRQPAEQEHDPAVLELPAVPGMGAVYCRWLVQGSGPYTVAVDSVKGGTAALEAP